MPRTFVCDAINIIVFRCDHERNLEIRFSPINDLRNRPTHHDFSRELLVWCNKHDCHQFTTVGEWQLELDAILGGYH